MEATRKLLLRGAYEEVVTAAREGLRQNQQELEWPLLLGRAQMELGRYTEARTTLIAAVDRIPQDLRLRLAAYEALRSTGAIEEADAALKLKPVEPLASELRKRRDRYQQRRP